MEREKESPLDFQIGGGHYKTMGAYQPWEVLPNWLTPDELRGFAKGTAIAYLARERQKGGLDDIAKARHTLQLYEEILKKAGPDPDECAKAPRTPPYWVCNACGENLGLHPAGDGTTWHYGFCEACESIDVPVTDASSFGYLRKPA